MCLAGGRMVVTVADAGVGIGIGVGLSGTGGLTNMRRRAEELGGSCTVSPGDPGGTTLTWSVPV